MLLFDYGVLIAIVVLVLDVAYRHGDRTFKNINTLENMLKSATKILNEFKVWNNIKIIEIYYTRNKALKPN